MSLRTPKERFLASTYSGQWGKICQSDVYEEAANTSYNQLQHELPQDCPVPQQACDAYQQLIGARKVLDILSSLYMSQTTPKPVQTKGLDYNAGI